MARGEYCARHGRYFGNVVPCRDCENEYYRDQLDALKIADDGWSDPVGRTMKPLMESTLQDLVASGPPDKEYQRLLRIEAAAREMFALDKGGFTNVDAWEAKYEALRLALRSGERDGG